MRPFPAALLLLLLAGCARDAWSREAETAAVYESLLEDHCCIDDAILQEVTDTAGLSAGARRLGEGWVTAFAPEVHEAVEDLARESRTVRPLPDSLRVASHDRRMGADRVHALLEQVGREHIRRLPRGESVVLISGVGFSADRKLAVVRMVEVCGSLCGGATLRALRRHPGGWVPAETVWSVIF